MRKIVSLLLVLMIGACGKVPQPTPSSLLKCSPEFESETRSLHRKYSGLLHDAEKVNEASSDLHKTFQDEKKGLSDLDLKVIAYIDAVKFFSKDAYPQFKKIVADYSSKHAGVICQAEDKFFDGDKVINSDLTVKEMNEFADYFHNTSLKLKKKYEDEWIFPKKE